MNIFMAIAMHLAVGAACEHIPVDTTWQPPLAGVATPLPKQSAILSFRFALLNY